MGWKPRAKPEHLAEKLRAIRDALGLSQGAIVRSLGAEDAIDAKHVSKFELGDREPSLLILLRYARLAGVTMDVLVDDELDLPARLPGAKKQEGVRRRRS